MLEDCGGRSCGHSWYLCTKELEHIAEAALVHAAMLAAERPGNALVIHIVAPVHIAPVRYIAKAADFPARTILAEDLVDITEELAGTEPADAHRLPLVARTGAQYQWYCELASTLDWRQAQSGRWR